MATVHVNNTAEIDDLVVSSTDSFTEDVEVDNVRPSLGLFRDRSTYEGQASGNFFNTINPDSIEANVGGDCGVAVDDSVADIGVVTSDIFGNELAIQKQTAGAHI